MTTISNVAVIEQPKRLNNITSAHVVVERDRCFLDSLGVENGVLALIDGDGGELFLGRAVKMHVTTERKCKGEGRVESAVRSVLLQ